MRALSTSLILIAAIINLIPVVGISAERLETLYDITLTDPNVVILMRHRAVLLAIVGGILATSAIVPSLRSVGYSAGVISMLSFVGIVAVAGDHNPALGRVIAADVFALACLLVAGVLDRFVVGRRATA